jgi:hypothetical protein
MPRAARLQAGGLAAWDTSSHQPADLLGRSRLQVVGNCFGTGLAHLPGMAGFLISPTARSPRSASNR